MIQDEKGYWSVLSAMRAISTHDDKVKRLLQAVYKPVLPPPEFKERLLQRLLKGLPKKELK